MTAPGEPLPCIEVQTGERSDCAVIWLHGLGADGNDFVPVVPELGLHDAGIAARFVFPHAPLRPVTINGGMTMRAWYDIAEANISARQDHAGIAQSAALVGELIAGQRERGITAARIVLAGFSQGGAVSLYSALQYPERLAGVVALSTYLPVAEHLLDHLAQANRALPVFYAHGDHDPVIPVALAERSRAALERAGYAVEWSTWPMEHAVCAGELTRIGAWLRARLGGDEE